MTIKAHTAAKDNIYERHTPRTRRRMGRGQGDPLTAAEPPRLLRLLLPLPSIDPRIIILVIILVFAATATTTVGARHGEGQRRRLGLCRPCGLTNGAAPLP